MESRSNMPLQQNTALSQSIKRQLGTREISRFDHFECLHMDSAELLESMNKLQNLITESSPINPRADVNYQKYCIFIS